MELEKNLDCKQNNQEENESLQHQESEIADAEPMTDTKKEIDFVNETTDLVQGDTASVQQEVGADVGDEELNEEDDEAYLMQMKKKRAKKIISIVVAVILLCVGVTVGVTQYKTKQEEKAYRERLSSYSYNLGTVVGKMLSGAATSEKCANLIRNVWHNAIYKKFDDETDKYTRKGYSWVTDFNEALNNLYSDTWFNLKIEEIESNREEVNAYMKRLVNPPAEYEEAYEKITELYSAYYDLTDCVTNLKGSYNTFVSTFNEADKRVLKYYEAVKIYY